MRRIERTSAFKRDYKRKKAGQHRRVLDELLRTVVAALAEDRPLPPVEPGPCAPRRVEGLPRLPPPARPGADVPEARRTHAAARPPRLACRALRLKRVHPMAISDLLPIGGQGPPSAQVRVLSSPGHQRSSGAFRFANTSCSGRSSTSSSCEAPRA